MTLFPVGLIFKALGINLFWFFLVLGFFVFPILMVAFTARTDGKPQNY